MSQEVGDIVHGYITARSRDKKRLYWQVLKCGLCFFSLAGVFVLLPMFFNMGYFADIYYVFFTLGIITISICPLDELDIDEFGATWPVLRTILSCLLLFFGQFWGFSYFPYTYIFSFFQGITCLVLLFGCERVYVRHYPRFTTLLSVDSILRQSTMALIWLCRGLKMNNKAWFMSSYKGEDDALYSELVCFGNAAVGALFFFLVTGRCWQNMQYRNHHSSWSPFYRPTTNPTLSLYETVFGVLCWISALKVYSGVAILIVKERPNHIPNEFWRGLVSALPLLALWYYGREALFGVMARHFDRKRAHTDGAFLGELFLLEIEFSPGDRYWVHANEVAEYICYDYPNQAPHFPGFTFPPKDEWLEATVLAVDEQYIKIRMMRWSVNLIVMKQTAKAVETRIGIPEEVSAFQAARHSNLYSSLWCNRLACPGLAPKTSPACGGEINNINSTLSSHKPRCIEWEKLSAGLMASYRIGSEADKGYDLSRPLEPGERIDLFISHAWDDDNILKWTHLSQLAENFHFHNHRYPTLWIDKFCLCGSDGDPTEELRGLCANICACNRLVALCGSTFPSRLWCAWEVFVMTAFQHKSEAIARVELILLISDNDVDVREAFRIFDVATTKCYSPMDQHRLMRIIDAVGRSDFNDKIRRMLPKICKMEKYLPKSEQNSIVLHSSRVPHFDMKASLFPGPEIGL